MTWERIFDAVPHTAPLADDPRRASLREALLRATVLRRRRRVAARVFGAGVLALLLVLGVRHFAVPGRSTTVPEPGRAERFTLRHADFAVVATDDSALARWRVQPVPDDDERWLDDAGLSLWLEAAGRSPSVVRAGDRIVLAQ